MRDKLAGSIPGSHRAHVSSLDHEIARRWGRRAKTVSCQRTGRERERPQVKVAEALEVCFDLGERGAAHQYLQPIRDAIASAPPPERDAALNYLSVSQAVLTPRELPRAA